MWNNRVILSGNLVKDVEVKVTEGKDSKHVTSFTVAVHRTRSKEDTAAVSYTHLDVYKRQRYMYCMCMDDKEPQ